MTPDKAQKLLKNPEFNEWFSEILKASEKALFSASRETAGDELMKLNVLKEAHRLLETKADVSLKLADENRKKAVI